MIGRVLSIRVGVLSVRVVGDDAVGYSLLIGKDVYGLLLLQDIKKGKCFCRDLYVIPHQRCFDNRCFVMCCGV